MIRLLPILACLAAAPGAMAACTDRVSLSDTQIDTHFATLGDAEQSELDRIRAYNELCRADDPAIRALARSAALENGGAALQATLLPGFLLERETLLLQPYDTGDLTDQQRDWIESNPPVRLSFSHKDPEAACIGLTYSDCRRDYVLDYSGSGVSIDFAGGVGELVLSQSGELQGTWTPAGTALRIPVRARLR